MYCQRCGTMLAERLEQGRPRHACPSCGWVDYRQLKVGAGALILSAGCLLLVRRSPHRYAFPGTWSLPSGYCEADETPRETACRETAEETGLLVQVGSLVDVYHFDDDPRGNGVLLTYNAEILDQGQLDNRAPTADQHEVSEVAFFGAERLPEGLCGGGHDQAILAWQARVLDRWEPGLPMRFCSHCAHPLTKGLAFGLVRPLCLACGYVRFREPKVGVSILAEQAGRVLMVRRAIEPGRGMWSLPSGFVEWDESPEAAAIRECEEETGLALSGLELVGASSYEDFRGPGINLSYRARIEAGTLRPGDDAEAVRFFAPAELPAPQAIAFKGHRQLLAEWQAQRLSGG